MSERVSDKLLGDLREVVEQEINDKIWLGKARALSILADLTDARAEIERLKAELAEANDEWKGQAQVAADSFETIKKLQAEREELARIGEAVNIGPCSHGGADCSWSPCFAQRRRILEVFGALVGERDRLKAELAALKDESEST